MNFYFWTLQQSLVFKSHKSRVDCSIYTVFSSLPPPSDLVRYASQYTRHIATNGVIHYSVESEIDNNYHPLLEFKTIFHSRSKRSEFKFPSKRQNTTWPYNFCIFMIDTAILYSIFYLFSIRQSLLYFLFFFSNRWFFE